MSNYNSGGKITCRVVPVGVSMLRVIENVYMLEAPF